MARVITNNGFGLGYASKGGGPATPILFLHGVGSDKSVWHPQLDYFGQERLAVALDYPGYGESDPVAEGTMREDYARAVILALDALGIEETHVCGLSLGGVVAIAMHDIAPHRCKSLILADTFALHPEGREIYERSLDGSRNLAVMAEARVDALLAAPANPNVRREVVDTMSRIEPAAYRTGAKAVWLADQRDRVQAIDVPTLILVGEQDVITPLALSEELLRLIPHARMETIASAGHLGNLENPARFNQLLREFIQGAVEGLR